VARRNGKSLVAQAPGSPGRAADRLRIGLATEDFAMAGDAAVELGPAAREKLPEALRPAFDAVCDAFALYEGGQDDPAREKLQAVGLSSPFLDWKLLLRGLIAYAGGDDARALDNWSRLAPKRLASQLIAPLRFALDPAYRTAHVPKVQVELQRKADRLAGGLVPGLRALQQLLSRPRLGNAFSQAELLLPELKREMPEAAARLAQCFRAAIIGHGEPADIDRYRRLFGAPADDPTLARLEAAAAEVRHAWAAAHQLWQRFEESVKDNPAWPAADRDRVRAFVWCRMGRNADDAAEAGRRLQPNAEACFKRAAELAPDLLEPHEQLFLMLRDRKKVPSAIAAGKRLLKLFPNHGPALDAMAELCQAKGQVAEALDYARRAVAANPLDRRLRAKLAEIHRDRARSLSAAANYAGAETELTEAFRLIDGRPDVGLLALAAAVAFKAGNAEAAEEPVRQGVAVAPAAAAYGLAVEAVRLKLSKTLKQQFDREFATALGTPTGPAAVALTGVFLEQTRLGKYVGQVGHEKKVQAFVEAAIKTDPTEADLIRLCERLRDLDWMRLLKAAAKRGQKRFPRSPFFPYFEAIVQMAPENQVYGPPTWKVEPLLEKARKLAEKCPPDDALKRLLRDLDEMQRVVAAAAPFANVLNELFDAFDEF
jgi:tetratricopeptide (TPR) repeat protein